MNDLLEVRNLTKKFGGFTAVDSVSFALAPGERLGLIGPNGSGKTTSINCVSGTISAYEGEIIFNGRNLAGLAPHARARLGVARSFQIPRPFRSMTIMENLRVPLEYIGVHRGEAGDLPARGRELLARVGLDGRENETSGNLTQVDLRKLELARALAARPSLLIVDEVMAGLSSAEVEEILAILRELDGESVSVIMIEHIMQAVMSFSERIICLDAGRKIADGVPDVVVADPQVERAYLGE